MNILGYEVTVDIFGGPRKTGLYFLFIIIIFLLFYFYFLSFFFWGGGVKHQKKQCLRLPFVAPLATNGNRKHCLYRFLIRVRRLLIVDYVFDCRLLSVITQQ